MVLLSCTKMVRPGFGRRSVLTSMGVGVLLCGLGWLARGRGQAPPGRPLGQLLPGGSLEADPMRFASLPGPSSIDPADTFGALPRARVRAGSELRNALLLPTTSHFTVSANVRPRTFLRLGAALVSPGADFGCGVHFQVRITLSNGRQRTLFARYLDPASNLKDRDWSDADIDLGAFAGQKVRFDFETRVDAGRGLPPGAREYAAWSHPRLETAALRGRANVILVSLDTLRADHLGCYGYARHKTSPSIDTLASQGVRFANMYSQAPWTTPSHASMLTGLYPSRHGVNQGFERVMAHLDADGPLRVLPFVAQTLATRLRDAGYETAAFTGGATLSSRLGFAHGFDVFREDFGNLNRVNYAALLQWIMSRAPRARGPETTPFFAFLHTFEVHAPYTHAEFAQLSPDRSAGLRTLIERPGTDVTAFGKGLEQLGLATAEVTSSLYDGDIRYADEVVGHLLEDLASLSLQGQTLVVVTADHGEEFADHDPRRIYDAHGLTLYEEMLRVPLILRLPGRVPPGVVVEGFARSIDILPTIMELAGLGAPRDIDGRSLAQSWQATDEPERPVLSEATNGSVEQKSLRRERFKYVALTDRPSGASNNHLVEDGAELYDLVTDPHERHNIVREEPRRAADLRQELEALVSEARRARRNSTASQPPDAEWRARLQSLGYVH
jgi:arylsulfatase A-like enzyme